MSLHVDFEFLSALVTLVWFIAFIFLCLWAWSRRRHSVYAAAARMPLDATADSSTAEKQDGSS
jgi:cbb3-type cytochrome oxidase subunit 3